MSERFEDLPDCAFVGVGTVAALIEASEATVWRFSRNKKLPGPRNLGGGSARWNVGELRAALAKMLEIEQSDPAISAAKRELESARE